MPASLASVMPSANGDQVHQRLPADAMSLDRGTAPEFSHPSDDIVVDLGAWRVAANDETLLLQRCPVNRLAAGKSVPCRQGRKDPGLPEAPQYRSATL